MGGKFTILESAGEGLLSFEQSNINYEHMLDGNGKIKENAGELLLAEFGKNNLTLQHMAELANNPDSEFNNIFKGDGMSDYITSEISDIVERSNGKVDFSDILNGNLYNADFRQVLNTKEEERDAAIADMNSVFLTMGSAVGFSEDGKVNAWVKGFGGSLTESVVEQGNTLEIAGREFILDAEGNAYRSPEGFITGIIIEELVEAGIPRDQIIQENAKAGGITITPEGLAAAGIEAQGNDVSVPDGKHTIQLQPDEVQAIFDSINNKPVLDLGEPSKPTELNLDALREAFGTQTPENVPEIDNLEQSLPKSLSPDGQGNTR